jgi:hypothetical protein
MKTLDAGETVSATFTATTYGGHEAVADVSPEGEVTGR